MYVAFIDHYDSFSFNIVDWLVRQGLTVEYYRHDDSVNLGELLKNPRPLVLSPGPGNPSQYSATLRLVQALSGAVPILGICLGHQILGVAHGLKLVKLPTPFHGSRSTIDWGAASESSLPKYSQAVSYNSLHLEIPNEPLSHIKVKGRSDDSQVQALELEKDEWKFPAVGVQFHPESFAGENHDFIAKDFRRQVETFWKISRQAAL